MGVVYAILDTDFTSKLHMTKNASGVPLIDHLLKLPYKFSCHEQIVKELAVHNNSALTWLRQKIDSEKVTCYTDKAIFHCIQSSFKLSSLASKNMFLDYLRQSCDVYSKSFYTTYYSALEKVEVTKSEETLFQMIAECDEAIGRHNNLGEIKNSFLLLVLSQITGDKVFQFCSDDKVARRHIIRYNLDDELKINCISAFGFFYIGKVKGLFMEPEAREYLQSWMSFNPGNCNITIETNIDRIQPDFPKESASDIFEKIWNDTMHLGADGFLQ